MIYSNNAECGEIFSLQSLFSTVQVEKFSPYNFLFYFQRKSKEQAIDSFVHLFICSFTKKGEPHDYPFLKTISYPFSIYSNPLCL